MPCRYEDCSGHGICSATSADTPVCACNEGYVGARCNACAEGFHRDQGGRCLPGQRCQDQALDPCGIHGVCDDGQGVIACDCDPNYEGPRCELCISGYARDAFGDCLQVVLSGGGSEPLPAECSDDTCRGHGTCAEVANSDSVQCACFPGYQGDRCDLCADGFEPHDDRCVAKIACAADDCGACEAFENNHDFPEKPDNCVSSAKFALDGVSYESLGGGGTIWLCGGSTIYGLTTDHVALEVGNALPGRMVFTKPIVALDFEFGARAFGPEPTMSIELLADDTVVKSWQPERGTTEKLSFKFAAPVHNFSLRSRSDHTEQVGVDNLVYEHASCQ
jgi:hypothetical protein